MAAGGAEGRGVRQGKGEGGRRWLHGRQREEVRQAGVAGGCMGGRGKG